MALPMPDVSPPVIVQGPFPAAAIVPANQVEAGSDHVRMLVKSELVTVYTVEPGFFKGCVVYVKPHVRTLVFYPSKDTPEKPLPIGPRWVGAMQWGRLRKGMRSPVMIVEINDRQNLFPVRVTDRSRDGILVTLDFRVHFSVHITHRDQVLKIMSPIHAMLADYTTEAGRYIIKTLYSPALFHPRAHSYLPRYLCCRLRKCVTHVGLTIHDILVMKITKAAR
ncbi:MAG: hypothetical protein JXB47_05120 [Anaerolineae bacterium]|nr:hypothetical protein [Anaerolineae bacterium]